MKKVRVTITMATDMDKKLRSLQAEKMTKLNESVSYSKNLDDVLRKILK